MTGAALALRTGINGLLQPSQNGMLQTEFTVRKSSKTSLSGSKEKEKFRPFVRRYLGRKNVAMLVLFALALLAFLMGFITSSKEEALEDTSLYPDRRIEVLVPPVRSIIKVCQNYIQPPLLNSSASASVTGTASLLGDPCKHFISPPVPPGGSKQIGPRPCPVCYVPVEHARARMPSSPSASPVLRNLTYFQEDNPTKTEPHGGSEFGGYPSLKQRNDSFDIKESMSVHCGFIKGCTPGYETGFDIDEADILELRQPHDIIVASAIFGNYDVIQQPKHISAFSRNKVSFYMFIDEETEAFMKNSSVLGSSKRVGLWRIIVVHNVPYTDPRRNGKVPKLLLHRLFPNVRYSIWIDGKLQLVADPYQILERFLWRQNASFAISRHYRRFDVFVEAEANKAAGKYDNSSINDQIEFYKKEGLTSYSEAKLPITSDVPEGCVIIKEHIPITNLFTCLWFNEVDRFTSRDQLSFSTVRDKVMAKVDWSINMFMDCERRNFVIQAYHRDILEQMAPPADTNTSFHLPILDKINHAVERSQVKQIPAKRARRSGSRRHRKVVTGNRGKF